MKTLERKYNLLPCLIVSVVGSILGGLAISGAIVPVTLYLLNLLPGGDWGIPPQVFRIACPAVVYGVPVVVLVIWLVKWRSRANETRAGQLARRARLDALMDREEES